MSKIRLFIGAFGACAALAASGCGFDTLLVPPDSSGWHVIDGGDLDTAGAAASLTPGWSADDLSAAMAVAKPQNGFYDFVGWDARWVRIDVDNPGSVTVRATGGRDYLMICETPDGIDLFGNDDFDTADCVDNGVCDPGMVLTGSGLWTCLFTVSPFNTTYYNPNSPTGGRIRVTAD